MTLALRAVAAFRRLPPLPACVRCWGLGFYQAERAHGWRRCGRCGGDGWEREMGGAG